MVASRCLLATVRTRSATMLAGMTVKLLRTAGLLMSGYAATGTAMVLLSRHRPTSGRIHPAGLPPYPVGTSRVRATSRASTSGSTRSSGVALPARAEAADPPSTPSRRVHRSAAAASQIAAAMPVDVGLRDVVGDSASSRVVAARTG
jgi:hypothetical protein